MFKIYYNYLLISLIFLGSIEINAQEKKWKTATSKDKEIEVKYSIQKTQNEEGKKRFLMEYEAVSMIDMDLDFLEEYLSNADNYKFFLESTTESKNLEQLNDSSWMMYALFDAPWPAPNSDVVQKYTINRTMNSLIVEGIAEPQYIEDSEVYRMQHYDISFIFEQNEHGEVQFTLKASFRPSGSVPRWMLGTWFPKGPMRMIDKLITHASNQEHYAFVE